MPPGPLNVCSLSAGEPHPHVPSRNKAVAEGAASFFLEKFVSTRIAKLTYGTEVCVDFDASNPDHRLRRGRITMQPSGRKVIPEAFSVLLPKVCISSIK